MNEKHELPRNLERDGEERALRRAQQQAREIAARTGTPLVIYRDGKVEKRFVDGEMASAPEQNPRTAEADQ